MNEEHVYTIESADGTRWYYEAHSLPAVLLAAACMRDDFPGEEVIVFKDGAYDAEATLMAQPGMVA